MVDGFGIILEDHIKMGSASPVHQIQEAIAADIELFVPFVHQLRMSANIELRDCLLSLNVEQFYAVAHQPHAHLTVSIAIVTAQRCTFKFVKENSINRADVSISSTA
jgi:hypothetical protein